MAQEKKKTTSRQEFDDEALATLGLDGSGCWVSNSYLGSADA